MQPSKIYFTNFEKKFKTEYEIMTKLGHPNLIKVYDFKKDQINDNYYIYLQLEMINFAFNI